MTMNQFGALCAMSVDQLNDPRTLKSRWKKRDRNWDGYPLGTEARQSWTGMSWTRTERGWRAFGGSTFPTPGDADEVREPTSEE